jgi:hypothetical protein
MCACSNTQLPKLYNLNALMKGQLWFPGAVDIRVLLGLHSTVIMIKNSLNYSITNCLETFKKLLGKRAMSNFYLLCVLSSLARNSIFGQVFEWSNSHLKTGHKLCLENDHLNIGPPGIRTATVLYFG